MWTHQPISRTRPECCVNQNRARVHICAEWSTIGLDMFKWKAHARARWSRVSTNEGSKTGCPEIRINADTTRAAPPHCQNYRYLLISSFCAQQQQQHKHTAHSPARRKPITTRESHNWKRASRVAPHRDDHSTFTHSHTFGRAARPFRHPKRRERSCTRTRHQHGTHLHWSRRRVGRTQTHCGIFGGRGSAKPYFTCHTIMHRTRHAPFVRREIRCGSVRCWGTISLLFEWCVACNMRDKSFNWHIIARPFAALTCTPPTLDVSSRSGGGVSCVRVIVYMVLNEWHTHLIKITQGAQGP